MAIFHTGVRSRARRPPAGAFVSCFTPYVRCDCACRASAHDRALAGRGAQDRVAKSSSSGGPVSASSASGPSGSWARSGATHSLNVDIIGACARSATRQTHTYAHVNVNNEYYKYYNYK
eukprot:scaffold21785_cov103-Isochrysis_galbana.AAC.1